MRAWVDTIVVCESAFRTLEKDIPPPIRVPDGDHFQFRYDQHLPKIVVVQKLARIITGLHALIALLRCGFYQEVGAVFRMLDEFKDDVLFMSEAVRSGTVTELHKRFMDEFFQPEFDQELPIKSTQKRDRVPRDKIHAAIARFEHSPMNPSDAQKLRATLAKANSGYIHGASDHILEMYDGSIPGYRLGGMLGTPRQVTFQRTAWDYFHRSLVIFMYAATSFEKNELVRHMYAFRNYFEQQWGRTEWDPPERAMRKLKRGKAVPG